MKVHEIANLYAMHAGSNAVLEALVNIKLKLSRVEVDGGELGELGHLII